MDTSQISHMIYRSAHGGDAHRLEGLLQKYGSDAKYKHSIKDAFHVAIQSKHKEVIAIFLKCPTIDVKSTSELLYGRTPLTQICFSSKPEATEIVKMLLAHPDIDVHHQAEDGTTAFSACCWKGSVETLRLLLDDGRITVDQEMKIQRKGGTPLFDTMSRGRLDALKYMIAYALETTEFKFSLDEEKHDTMQDSIQSRQGYYSFIESEHTFKVLHAFYADPKKSIAKYREELGILSPLSPLLSTD
jgi:hypothetical protein